MIAPPSKGAPHLAVRLPARLRWRKREETQAMSDAPRIEQFAPELDQIISTTQPIQHLADGFGGAHGPAEGPLWWHESGYLLFSDIHNNRRMKYVPGTGVSLFLE